MTTINRTINPAVGPEAYNVNADGSLSRIVVGTVADGSNAAEGTTTDAAYTTGAGTLVAILKGIFGKLPTLGQKTPPNATAVTVAADAIAGKMKTKSITLSGTPNTAQEFTIPGGSTGYRIYCATADILHNVGSAPDAPISTASASGSPITFGSSDEGNVAIAGIVENRTLDPAATSLWLACSTASAVVRVGFW